MPEAQFSQPIHSTKFLPQRVLKAVDIPGTALHHEGNILVGVPSGEQPERGHFMVCEGGGTAALWDPSKHQAFDLFDKAVNAIIDDYRAE
ncbi:hypothetical protein OUHCRE11_04750 [Enterobacter asburiae]